MPFTQAPVFPSRGPFHFPFLHEMDWMDSVRDAAFRILCRDGIRLVDTASLEKLSAMGHDCQEGRIRISEGKASQMLTKLQAEAAARPSGTQCGNLGMQAANSTPASRFDGWINPYPMILENAATGLHEPFTYDAVSREARFVDRYSRTHGFTPSVPGTPCDVPADLSSLARYRIACENSRGAWSLEPTSLLSAIWMFEMAEVMGRPIRTLPLYLASPLTMGDESFKMVMAMKDRIQCVHVTSMPSFGINTPMFLPSALSLALAETLGAAFVMEQLTGLTVEIHPQLYAFDLRPMNMLFGTPEALLFERLTEAFNDCLFNRTSRMPGTNIHSWAKHAGPQSVMEKTMLATTGYQAGSRYFSGLGGLSLDEVFSPVQLVLDIEMLEQVGQLERGICPDPETMSQGNSPVEWAEEVHAGLSHGYTGSDRTLDNHAAYVRSSNLADRANYQTWNAAGKPDLLHSSRNEVLKYAGMPKDWHLPEEQLKELDKLYGEAFRAHNGD